MRSTYTPADAMELFGDLADWWIAGGWAIDLEVRAHTRDHGDLDVAILRRSQQTFRSHLKGWDLQLAVAPGVLAPLEPDNEVAPPLHAVWCRPTPTAPWSFELLLNDAAGDEWLFRRDASIRMPLDRVARTSADGVPYLAPEIVLLYKAKNVREDDEHDFGTALPLLDAEQRVWLRDAIGVVHPAHPWLERLR